MRESERERDGQEWGSAAELPVELLGGGGGFDGGGGLRSWPPGRVPDNARIRLQLPQAPSHPPRSSDPSVILFLILLLFAIACLSGFCMEKGLKF